MICGRRTNIRRHWQIGAEGIRFTRPHGLHHRSFGRRPPPNAGEGLSKATEEGKSALIIAQTHGEGQRVTEELRTVLKEQGVIGKEREFKARRSTGWTDAQKGDARNYEPGMVVDFPEHQAA